jgi:hypothetical protein
MAASAPVIRDSVLSWDVCGRNNKKFVKTSDLKPYLTSVSGVDKFWVRGHFNTARYYNVRGVRCWDYDILGPCFCSYTFYSNAKHCING